MLYRIVFLIKKPITPLLQTYTVFGIIVVFVIVV